VIDEVVLEGEGSVTVRALERLVDHVHALVLDQLQLAGEALVTVATSKRLLAGMRQQMVL